jgi:hypothetical protein
MTTKAWDGSGMRGGIARAGSENQENDWRDWPRGRRERGVPVGEVSRGTIGVSQELSEWMGAREDTNAALVATALG